jgi:glycosyltransferase involved in cell wall biosynthesis
MRLDIVMPAHNEEHRIGPTLAAYRSRLPDEEIGFVVALDACTDRTEEIVREHMAADRRVSVLPLPRLGKGGVIHEAFSRSRAELVAFVDADGATPPEELHRLAELASVADVVIASRRHPASVLPVRRSLSRRITSLGFALGVRVLLDLPLSDTQCGAKVLRRTSVQRLLPHLTSTDLSFDVDLLLAAQAEGQRIVEVPTVWIDRDGSRVHPIHDTRRMGGSLLRLAARHRGWTRRPGWRRTRRPVPLAPHAKGTSDAYA